MISDKSVFVILAILFAFLIVTIFVIVENTRLEITSNLIEGQKSHGKSMTQHNAELIADDFEKILLHQQMLAEQIAHHEMDNLSEIDHHVIETYELLGSDIAIFALAVSDENNIIKFRVHEGIFTDEFVGSDISDIGYVKKFNENHTPMISSLFLGLDGEQHLASVVPIFDENDRYLGSINIIFNPTDFLKKYDDISQNESSIVILFDQKFNIVKHSVIDLVGENFFDDVVQSRINSDGQNNFVNDLMKSSISGKSSDFIFELDGFERLSFVEPVFVNDYPVFVLVHSVTLKSIFAQPENILFIEEIELVLLIITIGFLTTLSFVIIQTQNKKQKELEKLSGIGELSARLAHDIRNPLSNINMAKDMLMTKNKDAETIKFLKIIDSAIYRISHQVNEVLDYVKPKSLSLEIISLKDLLDVTIKNIKIPNNITLNRYSTTVFVKGDFQQLETMFANILTNAIQAITGVGKINIMIFDEDDFINVKIIDSGPGIDENNLKRIFEPMFSTKEKGTGLGLVSCKTIVEAHGGTISARNHPTTFSIRLPKTK